MNKFLSLEWFKNKVDHSIERVIENKLDNLIMQESVCAEEECIEPLYRGVKLVNDSLTILMNDGNIINKPNATEEDYDAIINARSQTEFDRIVMDSNVCQEKEEAERKMAKAKALQKGIKILEESGEFTLEGNTVYFKGISRSIPQLLVEKLIEVVDKAEDLSEDEEYLSLKRFFMWCCLNPRAEVSNELYRFLDENSFRITKQGFFVALRNVVTLHGSPELVHFISNTYNKVKAVWKKSPDDYTVFLEDGEYKLVHNDKLFKEETHTSTTCPDCLGDGGWYDEEWEDDNNWIDCENCDGSGEVEEYTYTETWAVNHGQKIGSLVDLYLDLPNRAENRFTDDWTKTFDIRVGKVVNMPKEDCNWSTQDCAAAGLHFTADQIHYVGCGDQSVLVLINPMKVVGIGTHKGRCYEYLPIMTVPREEATSILHDNQFDTLQLDEEYAIRELSDIESKVKEGYAVESSKYEFNLPNISSVDIKQIVKSLDEMKNQIEDRVVHLD
jgi:hypothetical protein